MKAHMLRPVTVRVGFAIVRIAHFLGHTQTRRWGPGGPTQTLCLASSAQPRLGDPLTFSDPVTECVK